MTIEAGAPAPAISPGRAARARYYIVLHYFLTNLGYFGLLSTLVVSLNAAGFDAGRIAAMSMVFTLTSKVAKVPLAPLFDRASPAASVLVGCGMAGIGFGSLSVATGLWPTMLLLALAGTGISVNALASKQLAAAAGDAAGSRVRVFSLVNIGINIAAAVSAPATLALTTRHHNTAALLIVAATYCVGGVTTFLNYLRLRLPRHSAAVSSWRVYQEMLWLPGFGAFLAVNFFGWFLYGQLFNVLALHVSRTLSAAGRLGWLYTLNALLVVCFQWSLTRLTERRGGAQVSAVVRAFATFVVAFVAAYVIPGYAGAVVFVVVFTVAEMMFVPSVDVLLLDLIGERNRAVGYSILSISTALGEGTGGGAGVTTYRWLADHGHARQFWLLASGVAGLFLLASCGLRAGMRRVPERVGADAVDPAGRTDA